MNTQTIVRTTSAEWLRRGIAIVGALLISGAVTLGLANRAAITVAPASVSAAQERFAALKQAQAEARDATYAPVAVEASGVERFAAMKERQAELRDGSFAPMSAPAASGAERFAAMKERQSEQMIDATMGNAILFAAPWVNERLAALKERQLAAHDTTFASAPAKSAGRDRFADLKQPQAELRDAGPR
jgi:hypothetical protein